jgi:hypothetical protein
MSSHLSSRSVSLFIVCLVGGHHYKCTASLATPDLFSNNILTANKPLSHHLSMLSVPKPSHLMSRVAIEDTFVGVPHPDTLFQAGQPWRQDFEERGWTANGTLTESGEKFHRNTAPQTWLKRISDGTAEIHTNLKLASAVIDNRNPDDPAQRRVNRHCRQIGLLLLVSECSEQKTLDVETQDMIRTASRKVQTNYEQLWIHLQHNDQRAPRTREGRQWRQDYEDLTVDVAEACDQLSSLLDFPQQSHGYQANPEASTGRSHQVSPSLPIPKTTHPDEIGRQPWQSCLQSSTNEEDQDNAKPTTKLFYSEAASDDLPIANQPSSTGGFYVPARFRKMEDWEIPETSTPIETTNDSKTGLSRLFKGLSKFKKGKEIRD